MHSKGVYVDVSDGFNLRRPFWVNPHASASYETPKKKSNDVTDWGTTAPQSFFDTGLSALLSINLNTFD